MACTSAQDYSQYKDLDLNFYLGSNLSIIRLTDKANIDYASVNVLLLPRNESSLKIKNIEFTSSPSASVKVNDKATFTWNEINTDLLKFGVISNVKVNNDFIKIRRKINFPVNFSDEYKEFTLPTKFIDIDEVISEKAHELVQGEEDLYFAVFNIADWVRNNVKYDLSTITAKAVQKSTWVYYNKRGVCDEITNLFISMLRSVGIPARFVSGTVYSNLIGTWGNHGWAEVYFPDYGWVPFDITFGQYGWADPSHLKLSETADSGENSVEYSWRSKDVDINIDPLTLSTNLDKSGNKFGSLFDLKISTVNENKFGFGSYVPIEVTATNLNDYYLGTIISMIKAPELVDVNFKNILLRPRETKSYYFIGKLQKNLSSDYEYTGDIEAVESFGRHAFYNILLKNDYASLGFSDVKDIIDKLNKRELKKISSSLTLNCKPEKISYYSDEEINIECKVKNNGNTLLKDVNVCLKNQCRKIELRINQEEITKLKTKNEKNILITAETNEFISRNNLKIEIIEVPNIFISGISDHVVDYKEKINLSFIFNTDVKAHNVSILVNERFFELNDLDMNKEVSLTLFGRELLDGLNIRAWYYDKKGNKYVKDFSFEIKVNNLPWYRRFIQFITFQK